MRTSNHQAGRHVITPEQLRAARGLLDWSRHVCGKVIGVSSETVKNIEKGVYVPSDDTVEKIINGFSIHGVSFFTQHGVSLKEAERCEQAE
ncbi:MAG: helix-turn-helix transcriptional regulator [Alphaproteobacteria bacterium]|nr:helix-turn-helix transcriptional regulator [Alphaproteobacteria bacterium]